MGQTPVRATEPGNNLPNGPRIDRARASRIMEDAGLDGLVLGNPISIYHLTGHRTNSVHAQSFNSGAVLACMPRDARLPIVLLIASSPSAAYANIHREEDCEVYLYADPADPWMPGTAGAGSRTEGASAEPLLGVMERRRADAAARWAGRHGVSAHRNAALRKALGDLGLRNARIGVDDGVPLDARGEFDQAKAVADAALAMARIRLVKTPFEIELMRRAARANAEAARAAVNVVRHGGNYQDLRTAFYAEACKRGNTPTWLIIDRVVSESFNAEFQDGQTFAIDAVSTQRGYHGDYGRTIFIGEPSKVMKLSAQASTLAWAAIREKLRPGLRFSDIRALGHDALRKTGSETTVKFTTHSVGLYHTDALGLGDVVLEEGMTISVDCPVVDVGIGGSAHLEDLTLITANGGVQINDIADPTIQI